MSRSSNARSLRRVLSLARRMNAQEEGRPEPTREPHAGWSRRHFMRVLAGTGAAAAAISATGTTAWAASQGAPRIVILGAGLAGLNAAYQLKKRGIESAVYESKSRVGGRVHTVHNKFGPGSVTDIGGELVNTNHADMFDLAKDFGIGMFDRLADAESTGDPATTYLIHRRVVPEAKVADRFRALARRIGRDAAKLDEDPNRFYPHFDKLSAKAYLDQNAALIPEPWVRELIEQSVRSEYGVEPEQASSLCFIYNLPVVNGEEFEMLGGSDERFLVEGGSSAIPKAMAKYLGDAVHLDCTCESITRSSGGAYQIKFDGGHFVTADILISALPLTVLRRLDLDLQLPEKFLRFISEVDLGINEKVIAKFKRRFWRDDHLFANEFWSTGAYTSAWDAGQRQPDRNDGVLTFFTGGSDSINALQGTPRAKAALFVEKLSHSYPKASATFTGNALRSNWLNDSRALGAYTNYAPGQTTRFAEYSWLENPTAPEGNQEVRFKDAYFIGEHSSSEFYGFMNGAAETGRLAANAILKRLGVI